MHNEVREYYGRILTNNNDLQTNACCDQPPPDWLKPGLSLLHEEVINRYYGCGLVAPPLLEGASILDLGSGSGRDCYLLSWLSGESGYIVGVDMTPEQLDIARRHQDYHRRKFGYKQDNVEFIEGYIEQLDQLNLADNSFDIVVSNCVINLCPDKEKVLREIYRVLKPGGEFYFSDIYADRRIDPELARDPILYGECLAGALYWNDFLNLAKGAGFPDPRLVEDKKVTINDNKIAARVAPVNFYSALYRLFKIDDLETDCEDYGQAVIYNGGIKNYQDAIVLDKHHVIERGRVFPVCGNTYRTLKESRYSPYFDFIGDFSRHHGIFPDCGARIPFDENNADGNAGCC